jgi:hypothetical protein
MLHLKSTNNRQLARGLSHFLWGVLHSQRLLANLDWEAIFFSLEPGRVERLAQASFY